jgi:choline-sulfatase
MNRHVLIVTIDSLRADHLSCYGHRKARTANLDSFAASGARFDRHLTSVSATLTSHCALLTGCTPSVNGINWNGVTTPRRRKTAAEIAIESGYTTTAITSWGGFQSQQVYGFQNVHSEDGAAAETNRGDNTIRRILEWLDAVNVDNPQLLWVHFIDPHTPDNCPSPFPQTYAGEVEFADQMIGQLLSGWDEKLGAENSVAVITADHGEHLNDHGIERGHGTLWPTNLWVPLLMRAPGLIEPGGSVPELTRQIDVLPTILDYCELSMPHNVEGMSLRGLIEGSDRDLGLVHCAQAIHDDTYTVTVRNSEYAFHFGDQKSLAHVFDLRSDPMEEDNLWDTDVSAKHSAEHSHKDAGKT